MNNQNNAAPLTGDEVRTAVAFARSMSGPSDATQPGEYVLAGALALLSKLRAEGVQAGEPIGFADPVYVAGRLKGMKWNAKIYAEPTEEATAPVYAALASAPVAGESREQQRVAYTDSCGHLHWTNGRRILVSLYAAPQASEAVRDQALAALQSAQRFIRNGIEFGYVRMPDADTPDPAHRTPGLIDAAIRALSAQPGVQANGGEA